MLRFKTFSVDFCVDFVEMHGPEELFDLTGCLEWMFVDKKQLEKAKKKLIT